MQSACKSDYHAVILAFLPIRRVEEAGRRCGNDLWNCRQWHRVWLLQRCRVCLAHKPRLPCWLLLCELASCWLYNLQLVRQNRDNRLNHHAVLSGFCQSGVWKRSAGEGAGSAAKAFGLANWQMYPNYVQCIIPGSRSYSARIEINWLSGQVQYAAANGSVVANVNPVTRQVTNGGYCANLHGVLIENAGGWM